MSLILLSGGLDSTTLIYEYEKEIKLAVSFNYGSLHNVREIASAKKTCEILDKKHVVIDLSFMKTFFKSALLENKESIPDGHYEDVSMKKTVVPFRNGIMLSVAAGIAESNGLKKILIANHSGDHAIYPDCRACFIDNMSNAVRFGTWEQIEIIAPYTNISKREIALIGRKINVPFEETYSCYKGEEKHCGVCGTCFERKEALTGFDYTEYQK